jgi:hypothetical protein
MELLITIVMKIRINSGILYLLSQKAEGEIHNTVILPAGLKEFVADFVALLEEQEC